MDKLTHAMQKNELWLLVKRLGKLCGEDMDFIEYWGKVVYEKCKDDLKGAIECCKELIAREELKLRIQPKQNCK